MIFQLFLFFVVTCNAEIYKIYPAKCEYPLCDEIKQYVDTFNQKEINLSNIDGSVHILPSYNFSDYGGSGTYDKSLNELWNMGIYDAALKDISIYDSSLMNTIIINCSLHNSNVHNSVIINSTMSGNLWKPRYTIEYSKVINCSYDNMPFFYSSEIINSVQQPRYSEIVYIVTIFVTIIICKLYSQE